jgi:probable F420-dependent oxidoreductase
VKFGIVPINIGVESVEQMVGLAQAAERAGFESVWTYEHVMVPLDYASKYPYHASGKMAAEPETHFIDPLIALTAIAMATQSLKLATGVNILTQVNPLYLAKQVASLDFVSNGRFMLGAGIGWLREEFDALGIPFERRGDRFDDYAAAIKKVWSGEVVEHKSDFIDWSGFKSYPLPLQRPHPPVIIGGGKGRIYERIAKHGDGWFAVARSPDELASALNELRDACAAQGRDFSEIEVTWFWDRHFDRDAVQSLADMGVHRLLVPMLSLGRDPLEGMEKFAAKMML